MSDLIDSFREARIIPARIIASLVMALVMGASSVNADWLITVEGKMIETDGPWTIADEVLTYIDEDGEEQSLAVDSVDLEASEETTALRAGKPYVPSQRTANEAAEEGKRKRKTKPAEEPQVILYTTSLCRECTLAEELLQELDVPYLALDINKSDKARRQYKKKAGRGGGLPVLDIGGSMVFRYNPRAIRQRVEAMRARDAEGAEEEAEEATSHNEG